MQSAEGWDYQAKVEQHASQKGNTGNVFTRPISSIGLIRLLNWVWWEIWSTEGAPGQGLIPRNILS